MQNDIHIEKHPGEMDDLFLIIPTLYAQYTVWADTLQSYLQSKKTTQLSFN